MTTQFNLDKFTAQSVKVIKNLIESGEVKKAMTEFTSRANKVESNLDSNAKSAFIGDVMFAVRVA